MIGPVTERHWRGRFTDWHLGCRNMKQAAMQRIILFVGLLLINIDSGDCAIRAKGDYKTTLAEINWNKGYLYLHLVRLLGPVGQLDSVRPRPGLWVWLGAEEQSQEARHWYGDPGHCGQCGHPQDRVKSEHCGPCQPEVSPDFQYMTCRDPLSGWPSDLWESFHKMQFTSVETRRSILGSYCTTKWV